MTKATSGRYSNVVDMGYDDAGRLSSESLTVSGQTYTVTSDYDAASRKTQIGYPDGSTVDRTYTDRNQLHEIKYNGTIVDTRTYDAGGRMTQRDLGNGLTETRTYRADNLVATIDTPGVTSFTYDYDANKNKTAETIGGVMSDYGFSTGANGYDAEDQLVNWQRDDGNLDQSWNLSLVGDWNSFTENSFVQNRTHGNAHELTHIDGTPLEYDAKGNLVENSNGHTYTWDLDNRMASATVPVGATEGIEGTHNYAYDALGRRLSKSVAGETAIVSVSIIASLSSPSIGQTIAQYADGVSSATPERSWCYGTVVDDCVSVVDDGSYLYCHFNNMYDLHSVSDAQGTVALRLAYSAYGDAFAFDASGDPFSGTPVTPPVYHARTVDSETEFYQMRARLFAPSLGRFVARDPVAYDGGINFYAFVGNAPTGFLDPTGHSRMRVVVRPDAVYGGLAFVCLHNAHDNCKRFW